MSRTLLALVSLPAVSGREDFVVRRVEQWAGRRAGVEIRKDRVGNLVLEAGPCDWYVTAHLDHPGFVVTGRTGRTVDVEFRGGVLPAYFVNAPLEFFDAGMQPHRATLKDYDPKSQQGTAVLERRANGLMIGRFRLDPRTLGVFGDRLRAHACDDLAGVAAALDVFDKVRARHRNVGVLLTRAEEVGFLGAIGACKVGTISRKAHLVCLEASRHNRDAPLGGGPIVRVGDAASVFDPSLTNQAVRAARSLKDLAWQRKLMVGGSCEATAFGAYGYRSTCLCLPLDNYHNMGDLDAVEAGRGRARVAAETISIADYRGLVRLTAVLVAGATKDPSLRSRLDELYRAENRVLVEPLA